METHSHAYDARFEEFSATYESFECLEIRDLIVDAGERIAALCLDAPAVNDAMTSLYKGLGLTTITEHPWRTLWSEADLNELLVLPFAECMFSLNGYAFFGLSPKGDSGPCDITDIAACIERAQRALDGIDLSKYGDLCRTLCASRARYGLDTESAVEPEDLADLAQITLKSMKNALAPSSGSGLELRDRKVTCESALRWLEMRGDFKESIWQLSGTSDQQSDHTQPVSSEVLFVPFAKDGTLFHPEQCFRNGKYTIGPKGSEQTFSDYRQALDHLARMRPSAYWRRPNTVGNWGIVTAIGFRPLTEAELNLAKREA